MTGTKRHRKYGRSEKISAVRRLVSGTTVAALASELGIDGKLLRAWLAAFRRGGVAALRTRGRQPREEPGLNLAELDLERAARQGEGQAAVVDKTAAELAAARRRLAELERKIGQQQLELDFFRQALLRVKAPRQPDEGSGAAASMASSKP